MCVIVDEAYCEFNLLEDPDASVELLHSHPNLVLLRTFSKVYGLCGLRVGFALCGSRRCRARSTRCASRSSATPSRRPRRTEALAHQDAVTERVTRTIAERISVEERLRALGPAASPTRRPTSAGCIWERSARKARSCAGCSSAACSCVAAGPLGAQGALRVTYGTAQENLRFLDALAEVLGAPRRASRSLPTLRGWRSRPKPRRAAALLQYPVYGP